jgi:hypothetical protein
MDVVSYDEMMEETEKLVRVLALADKEIEAGETVPIEDVMKEYGVRRAKP